MQQRRRLHPEIRLGYEDDEREEEEEEEEEEEVCRISASEVQLPLLPMRLPPGKPVKGSHQGNR